MGGFTNPIWEEIRSAHERLTPPAQQAVAQATQGQFGQVHIPDTRLPSLASQLPPQTEHPALTAQIPPQPTQIMPHLTPQGQQIETRHPAIRSQIPYHSAAHIPGSALSHALPSQPQTQVSPVSASIQGQQSLQAPTTESPVMGMPSPQGMAPMMGMPSPTPPPVQSGDQAKLSQMVASGPGVSQIYHNITNSRFGRAHPLAGKIVGGGLQGLATAAEAAGSMFGPTRNAEAVIPGTTAHHALLEHELERNIAGEEKARTEEAQQQEIRARSGLIGAQTEAVPSEVELREAETQKALNPPPEWAPVPRVLGPNGEPMEYNKATGTYRVAPGAEGASLQTTTGQPKSLEHVNLKGPNGQPMAANFHPDTGKYTDSAGREITNPVPWEQPTYASVLPMMLPTHTTEMLGPDNVQHRYQYNPKTQSYDIDMGAAPTGQAAHQIFQAGAIENLAPQIIADIQANKDILGNLEGYYKQWTQGTPVADPRASQLMTELMSFAAMQPALHAFRSTNALDAFEKMIGGLGKNPDATIATIQGLLKTPEAFTGMGRRGQQPAAVPFKVPEGAPAAPKEDNKLLKIDGKTVAKSQGGQWVAP